MNKGESNTQQLKNENLQIYSDQKSYIIEKKKKMA